MKICFSTLGCPEWSFSDIISTACDLGYDGVEIRGLENELDGTRIPEFTPKRAGATKALLAKKKIQIPMLTSACAMNDDAQADDHVFLAKSYVDTAQDMGIANIRVLADYAPESSGTLDSRKIAQRIAQVCRHAKGKGVQVLVETNGYYADSAKMLELLELVNEPNMGVLWDIHHPYRYAGEAPEQTVKMLGKHIQFVHIKDSMIENQKLRYTMVGYGDLPVRESIEALRGAGYEGFYSLEWLKRWDLSLEEPGIAFAAYAGFMKAL